MSEPLLISKKTLLPVWVNAQEMQWLVVGGGKAALKSLRLLMQFSDALPVTVVAEKFSEELKQLVHAHPQITLLRQPYDAAQLEGVHLLIAATGDPATDQQIKYEAELRSILVNLADAPQESGFVLEEAPAPATNGHNAQHHAKNGRFVRQPVREVEQVWKRIASRLVWAFGLMVIGHILISYLPLSTFRDAWEEAKPFFDQKFLFFILTGFLAQTVDGLLGMGYGVTSATCLMSFGINPVSVSAAIHTSEIFTSGVSGYSHYRFGNVNKKLFRHLVIPGVLGAILGALLLVYLGEKGGKWLMPIMATYALFLGIRILVKAFQLQPKNRKIKHLGWLAWLGGFLDSFGGGGWGPIVTSTLIAKGRTPKYTIGSVSLTEFFITMASAFTFFLSAGLGHWNVVLGLLIGGSIAAPFAARLAGKLPRKTMMILVGIMVIIWCVRMIVKSII